MRTLRRDGRRPRRTGGLGFLGKWRSATDATMCFTSARTACVLSFFKIFSGMTSHCNRALRVIQALKNIQEIAAPILRILKHNTALNFIY
jgi:hypothetical protein